MRKITGILVCLYMVWSPLSAVTYQTYQPSADFRSTSVYVAESRPSSAFGYPSSGMTVNRATGSLSAISAANFEALNSEGGACYSPSGPRRGRPADDGQGGSGAIGDVPNHSPIGDTPWFWFLLLAAGYMARKWKTEREK